GALIPLMGPGGIRIDGTVVGLTPEAVVLDLNHPLAKNPVHFVGSVITVRDATADEIAECTSAGCGGGCGGGCCGGEESDSCGGGCCGGCN
ncbi:MAG: peptidylprolyl isomerase, partial [Muribaculaceae bacterium]|nr:peptidylprolyl isomerase [Muribaculaceae bacterium]